MKQWLNYIVLGTGAFFLTKWMKTWSLFRNMNINATLKMAIIIAIAILVAFILLVILKSLFKGLMGKRTSIRGGGAKGSSNQPYPTNRQSPVLAGGADNSNDESTFLDGVLDTIESAFSSEEDDDGDDFVPTGYTSPPIVTSLPRSE